MPAWLYALLIMLGIGIPAPQPGPARAVPPPTNSDLSRIAAAVEGAESSHGTDRSMWRPNPSGPQGPMQVSAAAGADVRKDGDRFDIAENRRIGRDYLALLYGRYGNWTDAVIAYNWGPGNFARWAAAGRKVGALSVPLRAYVDRIMREFLAGAPAAVASKSAPAEEPPAAEIGNPALRKTYLANRVAIAQLHDFLDAAEPDQPGADAMSIEAVIRRVAARPGYEEFASVRTLHSPVLPTQAAVKQIAEVLIGKLRSECAAIVLVDQRGRPGHVR